MQPIIDNMTAARDRTRLGPMVEARLTSVIKRARYVLIRANKHPQLGRTDAYDLRCELWNVIGEVMPLLEEFKR